MGFALEIERSHNNVITVLHIHVPLHNCFNLTI